MVLAASALSCLALASGARIKRDSLASSSASCDSLSSLNVRGHTFGDVASGMCNAWPNAFGEFPLDLSEASRLLNLALSDGGIYDDIKNLAVNRSTEKTFCWKDFSLQSEGSCPAGFKDAKLGSKIAPVCSSECSAIGLGVSCGLGCASSKLTCAAEFPKQVLDVTSMLSPQSITKIMLPGAVDQAARFAHSVFTVVPNVVAMYEEYQPELDKQDVIAVSLILLFQYASEEIANKGNRGIRSIFDEAMKAVGFLLFRLSYYLHGKFPDSWGRAQTLNIKDVVAEASPEFLEQADLVLNVYTNPKCESSARAFGRKAKGRKGRKGRKGKGGR